MEIVAAHFCDQAYVGTRIAPITCIVEPGLHFELLYAVGVRYRNSSTPRRASLYITNTYPIYLKVIVVGASSVHEDPIIGFGDLRQRGAAQPKFSGVVHPDSHARRKPD